MLKKPAPLSARTARAQALLSPGSAARTARADRAREKRGRSRFSRE
jgi:hypothetical protein